MPLTPVFALRSARDTDKITNLAMESAKVIAAKVKSRAITELRGGKRFNFRAYLNSQLAPLISGAMLASHLTGFKRFNLMRVQEPILRKQLEQNRIKIHKGIAKRNVHLVLAGVESALKVLKKQATIPLATLQQKYDRYALKIADRFSDEVESDLRDTIADLVSEGAHVKEAIQVIGDRFDKLGIDPVSSGEIETIFRTQVQIAFNAGKWEGEQDPDIQEILWGYKYVTVGDDRVRDNHAVLEGTTLPKEDSFWNTFYPPNGYNCRCSAIPIFEQRAIVKPPTVLEDGEPVKPDKGFDFNPGKVFANV